MKYQNKTGLQKSSNNGGSSWKVKGCRGESSKGRVTRERACAEGNWDQEVVVTTWFAFESQKWVLLATILTL